MQLNELHELIVSIVIEAHRSECEPIPEIAVHRVVRRMADVLKRAPRFYQDPIEFSGEVADALAELERLGLVDIVYAMPKSGAMTNSYKVDPASAQDAEAVAKRWEAEALPDRARLKRALRAILRGHAA